MLFLSTIKRFKEPHFVLLALNNPNYIMNTFEELGLREEILKAVAELGFETPTPIQAKAVPHLLTEDRDLVALAQTGTGKTAAFGLPLLEKTDENSHAVQSLILCPTRELCLQITRDLESYSKYMNIKTVAVYGGAPIDKQIRSLKKGAQIVVGTPGRMIDLINRRVLKLANVEHLVLDEADEMLTMGFKDDLDTILSETPSEKQTLLFSATMPKAISGIAKKYMHNPLEVSAGKRNEAAANVSHDYYEVSSRDRYLALKRIADINPNIYGIVFCRTRRETKEVADRLIKDGYSADALHGDLSQAQRDTVMGRFREGNLQLLIATDVAARGLDVNSLTHVINFNLPDDVEVYTHRSGRTGRAGKTGSSIVLVTPGELRRIKMIERIINRKFEKKQIPTGKDICEKQLFKLIDNIEKIEVNDELIGEFLPIISQKLDWLSREELLKRFAFVEFNRFLSYYKNAPDLNLKKRDKKDRKRDKDERGERGGRDRKDRDDRDERRGEKRGYSSRSNFARFFVNIGEKDSLNPARLIGLINENAPVRDAEIGKIEVLKSFSFFEIEKPYADAVLNGLKGAEFEGASVYAELSKEKKSGGNGERRDDRSFKSDRSGRSGGFSSRKGGFGKDSKKKGKKKRDRDRY